MTVWGRDGDANGTLIVFKGKRYTKKSLINSSYKTHLQVPTRHTCKFLQDTLASSYKTHFQVLTRHTCKFLQDTLASSNKTHLQVLTRHTCKNPHIKWSCRRVQVPANCWVFPNYLARMDTWDINKISSLIPLKESKFRLNWSNLTQISSLKFSDFFWWNLNYLNLKSGKTYVLIIINNSIEKINFLVDQLALILLFLAKFELGSDVKW